MLKKRKKQVLYRFRTQTFRYAETSQDPSTRLWLGRDDRAFAQDMSISTPKKVTG